MIVCPKCGSSDVDHEQNDPEWESCKLYCYACNFSGRFQDIFESSQKLIEELDKRITQCEELLRGANEPMDRYGFQGKADGYKAVKEMLRTSPDRVEGRKDR